MPTSKRLKDEPETAARKYATAKILKSKAFAGYQQDFLKVILREPEYTLDEAKELVEKTLKRRAN